MLLNRHHHRSSADAIVRHVACQSPSRRDELECRKDKDSYVAEFAKNFDFSWEVNHFRKSWRLPLRLSLQHSR